MSRLLRRFFTGSMNLLHSTPRWPDLIWTYITYNAVKNELQGRHVPQFWEVKRIWNLYQNGPETLGAQQVNFKIETQDFVVNEELMEEEMERVLEATGSGLGRP